MKQSLFTAIFLLALTVPQACSSPETSSEPRTINGDMPRVIVMTDGEVDDRCSMVHFLLCASDFDVAAIIESNSCFQKHGWSSIHWLGDEIDSYEKVYPNLKVHDPNYPTPDYLRSVCFVGDEDESHLEGIPSAAFIMPGDSCMIDPALWPDTPGSDKIVEVLLEDDPRTVFIQAWGGSDTAAKAFQKLKDEYPDDYDRAISKVVMYNIWYQDGGGSYIETHHPKVTMLLSYFFSGTWDYGSQRYTKDFVDEFLHNGHGPLGPHYVQDYISEGDSPSFFHFIANGLRSYESPSWGGWGGAFYKTDLAPNTYVDAQKGDYTRWTEYVNRDFQARLTWCVTPTYEGANHRPVVNILEGDEITVHSGETVTLNAEVSDKDPVDLESLWDSRKELFEGMGMTKETFMENSAGSRRFSPGKTWWVMKDASTYKGTIFIKHMQAGSISFVAPKVKNKETVHIICESTDMHTPPLTGFDRVVVNILP